MLIEGEQPASGDGNGESDMIISIMVGWAVVWAATFGCNCASKPVLTRTLRVSGRISVDRGYCTVHLLVEFDTNDTVDICNYSNSLVSPFEMQFTSNSRSGTGSGWVGREMEWRLG